jgi:nitroreductase
MSELRMDAGVRAAITSRRSVRAFLPDPVPDEVVRDILTVAARAPSATNTQPWHVHVLTGAARDRLCEAVVAVHEGGVEPAPDYEYSPKAYPEPYLSRRRKIGFDMYALLGIDRHDMAGRHAQHGRNYRFFDAPVGMIFTLDRAMALGAYLDLGMFMQNVMIAARGYGLDTCAQAAWAGHHAVIKAELGLAEGMVVMCGMALGWADEGAAVNGLRTERMEVEPMQSSPG